MKLARDSASKWKKMAQDAMGNLTSVTEPRPGGGADYVSTYTYSMHNQLLGVSMTRDGTTQTRTFTYDTALRPATVTNPESGLVTYEYNADSTLLRKTDAKNQKVEYSYDSYKRVTQIRRYTSPTVEDGCLRTDLYYDTSYVPGFSQYVSGRLAAKKTGGGFCLASREFIEMYSYLAAGAVTTKRLRVTLSRHMGEEYGAVTGTADLDSTYSYDNEGKMTGLTYPAGGGATDGHELGRISVWIVRRDADLQ